MSEGVQQEEQYEQKAIECERVAAKLPPEDQPFRRMYLDLAANGARKRRSLPPIGDAETSALLQCRRRIAGEDAARGGLVFVCRNALAA